MISDREQISLIKSKMAKQEKEDEKFKKQFGDIFMQRGCCAICGAEIGREGNNKFVEVYFNIYESYCKTLNNYPKQIDNKRAFICQKCYENRISII